MVGNPGVQELAPGMVAWMCDAAVTVRLGEYPGTARLPAAYSHPALRNL